LEERKALDIKKNFLEEKQQNEKIKRSILQNIENFYKDKVIMLKDKIKEEQQQKP
jgi:hypothetical protein